MAVSIRNLTAQALTLKLVERHETPPLKISDPNSKDSNGNGSHSFAQSVSNFTHNVTDFFSGHSKDDASAGRRPSRVALSEKAEAFQRDEANLRIEPFTTVRTTVNTTELGKGQMVRLNFQGDGPARWRFDIPPTTNASQEFTPLTQNPPFAYTGVFIDTSNLLTIFETTDLKAWMKKIADETPLGALSLPGTHNSATHYKALPSVRCQSVPVKEQLENGVRFLDIRVQPTHTEDNHSDELNIVHGVFPITLTGQKKFRPMLKDVLNFLRENPTETVIMSIKREGSGDATDSDLAKRLHGHYTNNEEWFTEPRVPTLGEVRGRIVLVRRFALAEALKSEWRGKGWAINANNWPYNTPHATHGNVCVQDFCEVEETESIQKKIQYCNEHFERAANITTTITAEGAQNVKQQNGPLYLNFLTASNFWKVGCWPERIAAKVNPAVTAFLCEHHQAAGDKGLSADAKGSQATSTVSSDGDGGVGIVVCDWVGDRGDWDLVRCIVGMNGKLMWKTKQARAALQSGAQPAVSNSQQPAQPTDAEVLPLTENPS